jgi:hypothetical protein
MGIDPAVAFQEKLTQSRNELKKHAEDAKKQICEKEKTFENNTNTLLTNSAVDITKNEQTRLEAGKKAIEDLKNAQTELKAGLKDIKSQTCTRQQDTQTLQNDLSHLKGVASLRPESEEEKFINRLGERYVQYKARQ